MGPVTGVIHSLADIDRAIRASWAADTCSPDDVARSPWTVENPSWGQCDVTALVLNDLLGGDLVVGEGEPGRRAARLPLVEPAAGRDRGRPDA